ncbi:unnamed protein product [Schistosoma mattheei]|uniref:Uncharacterized protein n=1 Tax=Schistosoma mattheei TaxID=31246 RepID=A0A3P8ED65_9TREM|nr:unnamed protein product [Schistosoma mattheei]
MVHTPFVLSGYWSPCTPLVWNQGFPTPLGGLSVSTNPVKAPDIHFSSTQFRKQYPYHEKAVSRTSLTVVLCTWPRESSSKGRVDSIYSRQYEGIWEPIRNGMPGSRRLRRSIRREREQRVIGMEKKE